MLGVNVSADVNEIWNINMQDIMNKITHVLNLWSRRVLTIIGKVTIVKYLVLSKFVHFFISLPDPPPDLLKELEKRLYKFIRNKDPGRISIKVLIKKISFGGLRMTHISISVKSLKIPWLRIVMQLNNSYWLELSNVDFKQLLSVDGQYADSLINQLNNPLWKDLPGHWAFFCE